MNNNNTVAKMDPGKRKCIIEWVGCMTGETITSINQLENGSHLIKILEIIGKVYYGNPHESEEKLEFVMDFLTECYETSLTDLVDISGIIAEQDELEIGKLCVLLLNSMLLSDNNSVMVNAVMELPNDVQFEIKNIMEALGSDLTQLSVILSNKLEFSSASDDDSSMDLNKSVCPMYQVFSNSQLSPIDFPSPGDMWKVVANQKQEDLRHVERNLLSEQHLRAELEADLDDKNRLLQAKEAKLREYQAENKQLQARIDLLQSTSEIDVLEFQIKELENRLQEQSKLKFQLIKTEEENQHLYQEIEKLQQQVQNVRRQCQEEHRKHQQDLENQLEELQVLLHNKDQQVDVEIASHNQLFAEAKQANDFWKERVAQLEEQLSMQAFSHMESGENLNIFNTEKKLEEMDDDIHLENQIQETNGKDNSNIEENKQLQNELDNKNHEMEPMVNEHQKELKKLHAESEEKSQLISNELKAVQIELKVKKKLIKQQEISVIDLNERIRTLEREIESLQIELNQDKELIKHQQQSLNELSDKEDDLRKEKEVLQHDYYLCKHNLGQCERTIQVLQTDAELLKEELISKKDLLQKQLHEHESKLSEEKERTKHLVKENEFLQKQFNEARGLLKKFEEQSKIGEISNLLNETLQCEKSVLEKELCQTRELLQQLTVTKMEQIDDLVVKEACVESLQQEVVNSQDIIRSIEIMEHENKVLNKELIVLQNLLQSKQSNENSIENNCIMTNYVCDHPEQRTWQPPSELTSVELEKKQWMTQTENKILKLEITKTYETLQNEQKKIYSTLYETGNKKSQLENKVEILEAELRDERNNFQREHENVILESQNNYRLHIRCNSIQQEVSNIKELLYEKEQNLLKAVEQQKSFQLEKEFLLRELNAKEEILQRQQVFLYESEQQKQSFKNEREQLHKELLENKVMLEQNVLIQNEKNQISVQNEILQHQLTQILGRLHDQEFSYCVEIEGFKNQVKILEEAILALEIDLKEKMESEAKHFKDVKLELCQKYETKLSEQSARLDYFSQMMQEQQNFKEREEELQIIINKEHSNYISLEKKYQDVLAKDSTMYNELYQQHNDLQNKYKSQEQILTSLQCDLNSAKQIFIQEIESNENIQESPETEIQINFSSRLSDRGVNRCTLPHQDNNNTCETLSSDVSCNKQRPRVWSQPADPESITTLGNRFDVSSFQRSNSMILLGSPQTPLTSLPNHQMPAGSGILFMCEDEPLGEDYNWDRIKEMSQLKTRTFSSLHSLCSQESREMEDDTNSKQHVSGLLMTNRKRKQDQTLSGKKSLSGSTELDSCRRKVKAAGPVYQKPGPPTPGKNAQVKAHRPFRTPNSAKRLFHPLTEKLSEDSQETSNSLEKSSLSFPLKWSHSKKKSTKNIEETIETSIPQTVADKTKNSRKPLWMKNSAKKEKSKNL